ncbi:MAG: TIGR03435 family protein [Vicinamibacterales bacterium]
MVELAALALVSFYAVEAPRTQTIGDRGARFEVASVKPSRPGSAGSAVSGSGGPSISVRGNRLIAVNATLHDTIRYAYALEPYQPLEGGPRWLTDRFDISAVIPEGATAADAPRMMLRALLAERFNLAVRWTEREQSVYALIAARRDKRPGSGLKPSTMDCEAWRAKRRQESEARSNPPRPGEDYLLSGRPTCDMVIQPFRARIQAAARTMADFAAVLSRMPAVAAPVIDRTGFRGAYDFELTFAAGQPGRSPDPGTAGSKDLPSLFVALDEQLGLRLERMRGPVRVLLVEHLEPLAKD